MEVTCPNCQAPNAGTNRFCSKCGQALPFADESPREDNSGLDLPWLRAVQEQAEKRPTEKLTGTESKQTTSTPPAQQKPDEETAGPPPAVPIETQPLDPEQEADTSRDSSTNLLAQGPPDEPPPGWVVSILEPAAPQSPTDQQTYEPEELAHIMPWTHGNAPPEDAIAGENVPGLPPWLNNITVQETLQSAGATASPSTSQPADLDDFDLEGIEPFAPPTGYEELPVEPEPEEKIKPIEQVPEWLRSITANSPEDVAAPSTQVETAPPSAFAAPSTDVQSEPLPVARSIPVRAPRAGAVEAITALLQAPSDTKHVLTGMLPATVSTISETRRREPIRWLLPDGVIYLAILAALLSILIIRPPFGEIKLPASSEVQDFYSQVEAAPSGKPALVVYDWDATRSGEMTALSEAVTHHLMSRRIRFVTLSTTPQGPGFAQLVTQLVADDTQANYGYQHGRDYRVLGYLPGNEAALSALLNNFDASLPRDYSNSQKVAGANLIQGSNIRGIEDFGLIIALSSDEGELRGLIEQIGARTGLPLIAAVPQALVPLVRPYQNIPGAGLEAVIGGPLQTQQYAGQLRSAGRASGSTLSDASISDRLNAQSVASLLVGLVILAALIRLITNRALRR